MTFLFVMLPIFTFALGVYVGLGKNQRVIVELRHELDEFRVMMDQAGVVIRKPAIGDGDSATRSWTGIAVRDEEAVPPGSAVSWTDTPSPDRGSRESG